MIVVRSLGLQPYAETWEAMQRFTDTRHIETPDEIWLLQHPSVYTQGKAGKAEHVLNAHNIPIIQSDRGGQVTYHGPGQLVAYFLINLTRRKLNIRTLVSSLEHILITLLHDFDITAETMPGAPGVYVNQQKIASLGLRVRKGCSYHGLALNVSMDLTPFSGINPCGYAALQMTQITDHQPNVTLESVESKLKQHVLDHFKQEAYATLR